MKLLETERRKSIQSFCSRAVALEHGEAPAYGLAELLEILGQRIVAGFATPLRPFDRALYCLLRSLFCVGRKEQKNLLTQAGDINERLSGDAILLLYGYIC